MVERVWLVHPETGGHFLCPAEAAEAWADKGWVPGEPPAETNPVLVGRPPRVRPLLTSPTPSGAESKQTKKGKTHE